MKSAMVRVFIRLFTCIPIVSDYRHFYFAIEIENIGIERIKVRGCIENLIRSLYNVEKFSKEIVSNREESSFRLTVKRKQEQYTRGYVNYPLGLSRILIYPPLGGISRVIKMVSEQEIGTERIPGPRIPNAACSRVQSDGGNRWKITLFNL